jgi:hypothetical protein
MKHLLAIQLIVLIGVNAVAAHRQRQQKKSGATGIKLQRKQPSVYISFIRMGKIGPLVTGISEEHIWLQLHNNTRWAIWLDASDAPKEYGDASLYYTVEETADGHILIDSRCHVCSIVPLLPGKSFTFVIPRDYLTNNTRIRVNFSFDWENKDDVFGGREAEHSVFFYTSKLPK